MDEKKADRARAGSPETRILDPRRVRLERDAFDRLRLTIEPDEVFERVRAARAFPTSQPDHYIAFSSEESGEIGMMPELKGLDRCSVRILQEELELVYFVPVIQEILTVQSKHGATTWDVRTDRGETTIFVKDRSDIRRLTGRRVLFLDVHGMKYDIPDYAKLSDRSRALLESEI